MTSLKSLVPVKSSTEIALVTNSTAAVSMATIHPAIQSGIKKLLVAFPAGSPQQLEDRTLSARVYAEACEGFEECVVAYVLRRLPFHNPRNPFPPTAQDVYERCKNVSAEWKHRAGRYRWEQICKGDGLAWQSEAVWGWRNSYRSKDDGWNSDWGPSPDEPGCYVPVEMIVAGMRLSFSSYDDRVMDLPDKKFDSIPKEAFPDGSYEKATARRKLRAYEQGLSRDELEARQDVLRRLRWDGRNDNPDEAEVRRLTAELLERREADAEQGHEKYGREVPDYVEPFRIGDPVQHIKFGRGTVAEIADGGRVMVDFEDATRKVIGSFLEREPSEYGLNSR